jgi:Flp pilus assembly protein TadB
MAGPPITVTCECGARHDLAYGERWTCEACGRSYDAGRIPREEYDAVRRTQRRFRTLPVGLGLLVLGLSMFFTLTGNVFSVFFLLPLALTAWFVLLRPAHRRRYRDAIAELPRWDLRAE